MFKHCSLVFVTIWSSLTYHSYTLETVKVLHFTIIVFEVSETINMSEQKTPSVYNVNLYSKDNV